jgi:hypothetical protein
VYLGYLAEEARTNLCLQSQAFGTTWTSTDITVSSDSTVAPDGTTTADTLTQGTAGTATTNQSVTITANATYTTSCYFKRGNNDWVLVVFGNGANAIRAWFNVNTGTVGTAQNVGTGTGVSASIVQAANGFYRCIVVGAINNSVTTGTAQIIGVSADLSTTRVNNSTLIAWGGQIEAGAFATSYIPTTTASVTRNADVLTYAISGNALTSAGSAYAEVNIGTLPSGGPNPRIIGSDISPFGAPLCIASSPSGQPRIYDGNTFSDNSLAAITAGVTAKLASSWTGSASKAFASGVAGASQAFDGGLFDTSTLLVIGVRSGPGDSINGTVKNIRIWTRALADSQLVSLTS